MHKQKKFYTYPGDRFFADGPLEGHRHGTIIECAQGLLIALGEVVGPESYLLLKDGTIYESRLWGYFAMVTGDKATEILLTADWWSVSRIVEEV